MELIGRAAPVVLVLLLVAFCALVATSALTEADIDRDVHP